MSAMDSPPPTPLDIIVDIPTDTLGLGYPAYVDALAAVAMGGNPARFTVGIYGAWGVGKSSILKGLESRLREQKIPVVMFDAWRYARSTNVIVPLLHETSDELSKKSELFWKAVGRGVRVVTAELSIATPLGNIPTKPLYSAIDAMRAPVEQRRLDVPHFQLEEIGSDLAANGKRIIVLVDDLDRCPPDAIVQVLEAVHVLTDIAGFVFVLALDYAVLLDAVKLKYATADAALFIEKIIQIPFWIPEVDRDESVINEVVPDWQSRLGLDGTESKILQRVVHLALRTNPRQVKRLINSMLIAQRILSAGGQGQADNAVLLAVIGFQLQWPAEFKKLHIALATNRSSDLVSDVIADVAELQKSESLTVYIKELFPVDLSAAKVLAAMKFSQTAAALVVPAERREEVEDESGATLLVQITQIDSFGHFERIRALFAGDGDREDDYMVVRQQYVAFYHGGRTVIRVDGGARIGLRVFFPDALDIDDQDSALFLRATGGRAINYERALVVNDANWSTAERYIKAAIAQASKPI